MIQNNSVASQAAIIESPPKKQSKLYRELAKNGPLFIMLLPGALLTLIFSYFPIFGIVIAFQRFRPIDGILGSEWVGLRNFEFMFNSKDFLTITINTLLYNAVFIVAGLFIAVALAIALSELKNKMASKTYQTLLILPHFLSFVIVSYLVLAFLNQENGVMNKYILPLFGLNPVQWYTNAEPWPIILTFVHFWKAAGYSSIVYLAAIAGIDMELYEAAKIDGANKWQQIKSITLPSLMPIMIILSILNIGKIFNADFGLFYQVTQQLCENTLFNTTGVINTYVYTMMMKAGGTTSLGMSSAVSFLQAVISFALVVSTNLIVKKIDPEKALF